MYYVSNLYHIISNVKSASREGNLAIYLVQLIFYIYCLGSCDSRIDYKYIILTYLCMRIIHFFVTCVWMHNKDTLYTWIHLKVCRKNPRVCKQVAFAKNRRAQIEPEISQVGPSIDLCFRGLKWVSSKH